MTTHKTNVWDAIVSLAPAIFALLFCLGVGGCCYLCGKGNAEEIKARQATQQGSKGV